MIKIIINRTLVLFLALAILILFEPVIKYVQYHSHIIYSGQIKYFREGNLSPDRWILGYLTNKYLTFLNRFDSQDKRLDKVNLYYQQSKLNKLVDGAPTKHRNWKSGYLNTDNSDIQKIKFRLRGENARNYALRKKSYKIKVRKKNLLNDYREFYYINPFDVNIIKNYVPFLFAKKFDILSPFSRIVELHTNDEYQGVYLEVYATDELFLRNNNLMPTSIFKHSIDLGYKFSDPQTTGFMNGNLFFRQSKNNFDLDDQRILFNNFLSRVKNDESRVYKENLDINKWVNYSVYRILSGDFHSNGFNNLKLNVDNHIGRIQNIVWDPISDLNAFKYKTDSFLNYCTNLIDCRLTKEADYRYEKIKLLYDHLFIKNTYNKVIKEIKENESKITNSLSKDSRRLDLILNNKDFINEFFNSEETISNDFKKIYDFFSYNNFFLKKIFQQKIKSKWNYKENKINIFLNGFKPITNIEIKSDKLIKNIYYDINNNGLIDEMDHKIENNTYSEGKNNFDILLFSEITCIENKDFEKCANKSGFDYSKHTLLIDSEEQFLKIKNLKTSDEFLKESYDLEKEVEFNNPYVFNEKNYQIDIKKNPIIINSDQYFYKDMIFNEEVIVKPGVTFYLDSKKSILFKKKVIMSGLKENPIIFKPIDKDEYFGTIALFGKKTKNSDLKNIVIERGSGNINLEGKTFISMLSIHDTENINLENINLKQNNKFDDLIHIIYSNNITLKNVEIINSKSDAIDIDISKVYINNLNIKNAGNDCLDLMMSEVQIENSTLSNCGDKGISVGEKSKLSINQLKVKDSSTGLAAKDNSYVDGSDLNFVDNKIHIDTYNKNWQYGLKPSIVNIKDSEFYSNDQDFNIFKTQGDNFINLQNGTFFGDIENTQNVKIIR
tara:strand:- start:311 stop:2986 length:2676 start_codon:yes stop_codon:yes gene_type:complete